LGTRQDARSFHVGRASFGARFSAPWWFAGTAMTPYAGLYGDYRFSSDDVSPVNGAQFGVQDGWSARVTGGVSVRYSSGLALSLDGEVGGLSADETTWTVGGRGSVPF
jgi:Autotransporter beta-domain